MDAAGRPVPGEEVKTMRNRQEGAEPSLDGGRLPEGVPGKVEPIPGGSWSPDVPGSKRMLSTEDPDYAHPPDAKRMREMQQRAQDELSQRVIKVVDKELHDAIMEKQVEMEEIDARILKLQQCLHTLRYCVSLNYYFPNKGEVAQQERSRGEQSSAVHPAVKRQLGKAPAAAPQPSHTLVQVSASQDHSPDTAGGRKSSLYSSEPTGTGGAPTVLSVDGTKTTAGHRPSEAALLPPSTSQHSDQESCSSQAGVSKDLPCPRPPSPKYLPPRPPENPATISQGRHQRFQSKRRVIVGNTYQFLAPVVEEEAGRDAMKYKWQVYVRSPPHDPDTSTFLHSVTFILDHSYAPHHVVTIKQPPFVLSRRGWGQFKVQLVLKFIDHRNKQVRLLHPLVLSRPDDSLSLTGLWRLGQENWYDLWVYLPEDGEANTSAEECVAAREDSRPASLARELEEGVVASQVDENTTVQHEDLTDHSRTSQHPSGPEKYISQEDSEMDHESESLVAPQHAVSDIPTSQNSNSQTQNASPEASTVKGGEEESAEKRNAGEDKRKDGVNGKVCKIQIRHPDGSLQPYFIPAHMYSLAVEIARGTANKKQISSKSVANGEQTEQKDRAGQNSVLGKDSEKQLVGDSQLQGAPKLITLQPATTQLSATATSSNRVAGAVGVVVKGGEGANHHTKDGSNTRKVRVVPASFSTVNNAFTHPLVVKTGTGGRKFALVQHLNKKTVLKEVSASDTIQSPQVQILNSQAPTQIKSNVQLLPIKIVKGVQGSGVAKVVHPNTLSTANIRLLNSNGQQITAEKLKGLGKLCIGAGNTLVNSRGVVTGTRTPTTTIIMTPSTTTTTTTSSTANRLVQECQALGGASVMQLLTGKSKMTVTQLSPLKLSKGTAPSRQVKPLVVCSTGSSVTVPASVGLGTASPTKIKISQEGNIKCLLQETTSPTKVVSLLKAPTTTPPPTADTSLGNHWCLSLGEHDLISKLGCDRGSLLGRKNEQQELKEEEEEEESLSFWEGHLSKVREACKTSTSSEACVSAWLKALPLVHPCQGPPPPFSFCRATSTQHFLSWPLAKQRASEFQRAREVQWRLKESEVEGWQRWTVCRIVAWARGHAHTPVPSRPVLRTDMLHMMPPPDPVPGSSLSHAEDLEGIENQQSDMACYLDLQEVNVVDSDEDSSLHSSNRLPGSPVKQQQNYLTWAEGEAEAEAEAAGGCEWVGHLTSQLRLPLLPEEVAVGCLADVARATLWKAVKSLMEDLLRAAHFQAWRETTTVPPPTITLPHVLAALTTARPEFDIFSDHGLGTPSEVI